MKRILKQPATSELGLLSRAAASSALVLLGSLALVPSLAAKPALHAVSVAGVVRDVGGTPQVGILVELLRGDSTVVSRAFTDRKGAYSIAYVLPGQYSLRAEGSSFLPTLKQNLRIRAATVVDLTVSTLYDLMQFLPQSRRVRQRTDDDWAWTLRSAQSRPLLRWQQDGSPELVWDGSAERSDGGGAAGRKRRAQVAASSGGERFGGDRSQVALALLREASSRRRTAVSAQFDPEGTGMLDVMFGLRQEMAESGMGSSSMQTVFAAMTAPTVGTGEQRGLTTASLRAWESLHLLDGLDAEAGSEQVLASLGGGSEGGSHAAVWMAMPFASVTVHRGNSAVAYRLATARSEDSSRSESFAGAWLPVVSERDGQLQVEHGMHQELGWSRTAGEAEMQVTVYQDRIDNPSLEASGRVSAQENRGQWLLVDDAAGLLRTAGPDYSATGITASVESRLPGHNRVKLSYASGDALVMPANAGPDALPAILGKARPHRAQMYSLVLKGSAEGTGTRWRASYRWQPSETVTAVAPFAVDGTEPYLNIALRQPIHLAADGGTGLEAQLDLRNLLAEGYAGFVTSDGTHLYFAQAQRSIRGGLAFTF